MKDIKCVFNYDMPGTAEDYVHRIGRTARAGKKGIAYSFFTVGCSNSVPQLWQRKVPLLVSLAVGRGPFFVHTALGLCLGAMDRSATELLALCDTPKSLFTEFSRVCLPSNHRQQMHGSQSPSSPSWRRRRSLCRQSSGSSRLQPVAAAAPSAAEAVAAVDLADLAAAAALAAVADIDALLQETREN